MPSTELTLNCWIANEFEDHFPVGISSDQSVGHLRIAIHNALPDRQINSVDVRRLKLWKVSTETTQDYKTEWGKLQSSNEDPLCETDLLSDVFSDPTLPGYLHVIVLLPPPSKKRPRSPVPEEAETSKKMRTDAHERRWNVDGAIYGPMTNQFYFFDPAGQKQNKAILDVVESHQSLLITGPRASGKTTRLFRLRELLQDADYICFYFTFERVDCSKDPDAFWSSVGEALQYANDRPFTIFSAETFIDAFAIANWDRSVVLLIDELSEMSPASEEIRNSFFGTLHRIQQSQTESAVTSVIAAGKFSAIRLTTSNSPSAFKFSTVVQSSGFTLEETRQLFDMFARDNNVDIANEIVDEIWDMSNGHPGVVCVCGRLISDNLKSLRESKAISYRSWQRFSLNQMHEEIIAHNPFRGMIKALCKPGARPAVQLYRALFSGYLEEVEIKEDEEDRADLLTSEGVLSRPDLSLRKYLATSPLTDGVIRNQVINQICIMPSYGRFP